MVLHVSSMKETSYLMNCSSGGKDLDHFLIMLLMLISSSFMKIIPILETVAGDANCKLSVSNMKLTLEPKDILSPVGRVNKWLSSKTEFNASIHSGSTSPSHIIQFKTYCSSLITCLADAVSTPSENYLVSLFMCPKNADLGIDLGFIRYVFTWTFNIS